MTWGIQNREVAIRRGEIPRCHFYGHATFLLLLCIVHHIGKGESNFVVDLSLPLIGSKLLVRDNAVFEEYLA